MLIVSCHRSENEMPAVERAEIIVEQDPEEALEIMRSVDRNAITKREDLAHYALVYSEACYYNRILVSSDSLTHIAVDYYKNSSDHEHRARSYFQHSLVLQLNNRMPEAMIALMESLSSLESYDNLHLKGVVHRTMGDIYRARYCYTNSLDAYNDAYLCFTQLELPYHCYYTKYNMGQVELRMHNYDEAEALFIEARDYAIETEDYDFLCAVLHELCEIYLQKSDYAMCRATVDMFEKYDCVLWFVSRYYAVKAIVTSEEGNNQEALRLVAMAESVDSRDEAIIEEAKYHIYNNMGDMATANEWLQRINNRLEAMILEAADQPVLNNQIDLLQNTLEHEENELRASRQRNIAIYVSIAILISLLLGFLRGLVVKKNRDIQRYIETIHDLQLTPHRSSDSLSEAVDKLYNDRLNDLNHLCETYYEHSDTSRHATKVFEQVRQTIEAIKGDEARITELESLVNNCKGNLMTKLREQCPKLNIKEQRVVLYSYAGFSSRAICVFMETNPVALSKMKYRIKLKIKECNAPDADLLISSIGDR
ncbi:MAG: tetratricopeptide repeat protein [Alistipes sp.]|nr:tetratricopeptide repeat protein [Alistipes sp.]